MSEETQPGSIIFCVRWRVASSLNHEFLQATMMLCFALSRFHDGHVVVSHSDSSALHRQNEIIEALTITKALLEKDADDSVETNRAAIAIASVLKQEYEKSSSSDPISLDCAKPSSQVYQQSATTTTTTIDLITGFPEESLGGVVTQSYPGFFDPSKIMNMMMAVAGLPFSANDASMVTLGSLWDEFVTESIDGIPDVILTLRFGLGK